MLANGFCVLQALLLADSSSRARLAPTVMSSSGQQVIKSGSRPVSRVLSWAIIHLGVLSPASSSNLPEDIAGHDMVFLFGLAPGGVYHATSCCQLRGALLPHHFTLTCKAGGIFSVALSVGSRPPGVTWHPALWSPDFPPFHPERRKRDCLAGSRGYCPLPGISLIVF